MSAIENVCPRCGKTYDDAMPKRPRGGVRMSTFDKLDWMGRNAFSVTVHMNDHRAGGSVEKHSPNVREYLENDVNSDFDDDSPEDQAVKAECIRLNQLCSITVYMNSVGSYHVSHWNIATAIDQVFESVHKEIVLDRKYNR